MSEEKIPLPEPLSDEQIRAEFLRRQRADEDGMAFDLHDFAQGARFAEAARDAQWQARCERAEADARRWRFARESNPSALAVIAYKFKAACEFEAPDEAIDAAIAAQQGEKE